MSLEMSAMGLGVLVVGVLALLSARRRYNAGVDAMICAAVLAAGWGYVFVGETWFPAPPPPPYLPAGFLFSVSIVDGLSASLVAALAYSRPAPWKTALFGLLAVEIGVEVAFWAWATLNGTTPRGLLNYRIGICNVLYALQLLLVGWAGGAHAFLGWVDGQRPEPDRRRDGWPEPVGAP